MAKLIETNNRLSDAQKKKLEAKIALNTPEYDESEIKKRLQQKQIELQAKRKAQSIRQLLKDKAEKAKDNPVFTLKTNNYADIKRQFAVIYQTAKVLEFHSSLNLRKAELGAYELIQNKDWSTHLLFLSNIGVISVRGERLLRSDLLSKKDRESLKLMSSKIIDAAG